MQRRSSLFVIAVLAIAFAAGPALADLLRSAGLKVASDGTARIRVSGTLASPRLR